MIFTLDTMVALAIFLAIMLGVLWVWGETYRQIYSSAETHARMRKLLDVTDSLVKTTGDPVNWFEASQVTDANTYQIGLAKDENVLDRNRLNKFNETDMDTLKTVLGLMKEDFELTVIANWTTDPVIQYNVSGLNRSTSRVFVVERVVLLDGDRTLLRLKSGYN